MTTVTIACDVSQPDGTEFATARLEFAMSGPDYDTASGETIPAVTTYVDLDASGQGEADLWPVDLGTRNTFYSVVLRGSVLRDGRTSEVVSTLGRIQPQAAGGQTLADLLAQSSGGIVVGSVIYDTLADAVAAALPASCRILQYEALVTTAGGGTVNIGTTNGGGQIAALASLAAGRHSLAVVQPYIASAATLYVNASGYTIEHFIIFETE